MRRETGLPLRSITGFLRISKSSYEYQQARLATRRDWDADIRHLVRELFAAENDSRGHMEHYCKGRIKEPLGWMSPNEFRRNLGPGATPCRRSRKMSAPPCYGNQTSVGHAALEWG